MKTAALGIRISSSEEIMGIIFSLSYYAGKSTSLLALMGFIPITSGRVCVGGVDIQELPLAVLRGAAAVVPQEAVIFQGTFRQNLDPKGEYK